MTLHIPLKMPTGFYNRKHETFPHIICNRKKNCDNLRKSVITWLHTLAHPYSKTWLKLLLILFQGLIFYGTSGIENLTYLARKMFMFSHLLYLAKAKAS